MGYAIAESARAKGYKVILISGPTAFKPPAGIKTIAVTSARDMEKQCLKHFKEAVIVIAVAAVSDYRPKHFLKTKMKSGKQKLSIMLSRNPDIIGKLAKIKGQRIFAGFALETGNSIENAEAKLKKKKLDIIILNSPETIESDSVRATMINKAGKITKLQPMKKSALAYKLLNEIEKLL
jgi:phosphopantothenoylcysteine decarboxylase/phosphopantothenate--cysteine ligase